MIRALTAAATGLDAQQANMQRISNDIANANTDGYKRSRTEFEDLMYETIKEPGAQMGAATSSPTGVQIGNGVRVGSTYKVFEQGSAKQTAHPYDLMIDGKGFFPIQLPSGEVAYTRTGSFRPDAQGRLVTSSGSQLLPQITIPSNAVGVKVGGNGEVTATLPDGQEQGIGQIQVVTFMNDQGLSAAGGNLYKPTAGSGAPVQMVPGEDGVGSILQGALEGSNVNLANSMVDMISTQRNYELGTKVMGAVDNMLGATTNIK